MSIKSSTIFINFIFVYKVIASITVVDIGILTLVENSVGITFFVDIINDDRQNTCRLYSQCKRCCFVDSDRESCNVMVVFGEDILVVKPKDRNTLLYVAPMLFQHDLIGYCKIVLVYDLNNTKEEIDVTIPFDTRVGLKNTKMLTNQYIGTKKIRSCDTLDENSLNNCEPVDCNIKYLDNRPIYDHTLHKCVEVPICLTNPDKELPDYVYVSSSNTCRNLDLPLTVQDIYAISTGLGTVTTPHDKMFDYKIKIKSNCSTISENLSLLRDLISGKMCPSDIGVTLDYNECLKSALITIGVCIFSICTILLIIFCCVNSMAWLFVQWSDGNLSVLWKAYKNPLKRSKCNKSKRDRMNSTIKNTLLREVIVKDIPLELRNSVIDVCDRMGREVESKKRYRKVDVGSQISLQKSRESMSYLVSTSTSSESAKE